MATYRCTIDSTRSPEDAFDYLARFSNAREWDPSAVSAKDLTNGPVRLGSEFEVVVRTFGRELPFRYRVTEYERPERVVVRAERGSITSQDTMTVTALPGGGSAVTYHAELLTSGLWRLLGPVLAASFRRIGAKAETGLRRYLGEESR